MTVNNLLNVRFQIPSVESDDELKARFLCRYPKAMTRAADGHDPFDTYAACRLFRVEAVDEQSLKAFCLEMNQTIGATAEVGVSIDPRWWDCPGDLEILDRLNKFSTLIFDPKEAPLDQLRWLMLSWVCKALEPNEDRDACRKDFSYYLDMPETELRINTYRLLSNLFFKKASHNLPMPDTPLKRYNYREEFEADYKRFIGGGKGQDDGSFVENSTLIAGLWFGPLAVAGRMSDLKHKTEKLEKVLADPAGTEKYNQEIEKHNREFDDDKQPATRDQLEALRDACVSYQKEIRAHLPEHWINWICEKKILNALDVRFWVSGTTTAHLISQAFLERYPSARIQKKVGYCRGVKTHALAFLVTNYLDGQDEWDALSTFSSDLLADNVSGGAIVPVHSGDWDHSCDGIADFSTENMRFEIAKLAYSPNAAPVEGLRAALIYDVLANQEEDRFESIARLGSASEGYLRDAAYKMIDKYSSWSVSDYDVEAVPQDHERFVLNGHQEAPGTFLRESKVLRTWGVTLRAAIEHMDVKQPGIDHRLEQELFGGPEKY